MNKPLISILLPIYNAEAFLEKTLSSLTSQTFTNFELIAINDGSTDGSLKIVEEIAKTDSRIFIYNQPNSGLIETLNRGLKLANCELIARADADDIYHPERLELQYRRMNERPEIVLLGARTVKIDGKGRTLYQEFQPTIKTDILDSLAGGFGVIPHPVAMYRKSAVIQAGGYSPKAKYCEDVDLWIRLSEIGEIANLNEHLVYYRVHSESICSVHWKEQRENIKKIATKWQKSRNKEVSENSIWNRPPQNAVDLALFRAGQASQQGYHQSAIRQSLLAIKESPKNIRAIKTLIRCGLNAINPRFPSAKTS